MRSNRTFHLLVDARTIRSQPSGVGSSVYRHLLGLERLIDGGELPRNSVSVLRFGPAMSDPLFSQLWEDFRHLKMVDCPHDPRRHPQSDIWQQWVLPKLANDMNVSVLLSPAFTGPLRHQGFEHAVMIHDDLVWSEPLSYPWKFRKFMQMMTGATAASADRVIFVSEDARNRICRRLHIFRGKTMVVHNAYDDRYFFMAKKPTRRERLVVMVASEERRKNHETAMKSLRQLPDIHLVCVGFRGAHPARERELMEMAGGLSWEIAPPMDDSQLGALIRRSAVLIMPTHGEGFGLPLLESIACGTPVIASDIPVLREVGSDFVTYLPPKDVSRWKAAIKGILDQPFVYTPELVGEYLQPFRPENTARQLVHAIAPGALQNLETV